MGNPINDILHGMGVGHIYYFLADVIPAVYGKDVLKTPQFLIDTFGVGEYTPEVEVAAAPRPVAANEPARGGGHNWGGRGQALGDR